MARKNWYSWSPASRPGQQRGREAEENNPLPLSDAQLGIWFAGLSFSTDGKLLGASMRPAGTGVWEVATGKEVWHDAATGKIAFSPDGRILATGGWDKQLRFRDARTGKLRSTVRMERPNELIDAIFFSFDLDANRVGTWLLYVSVFFAVWSAWNYFTGFVRAVYGPTAPVRETPRDARRDAPAEPVRPAAGGPGRGP